MKKLILTSAFILVSIITVLAQANRPGQPIGGIVVGGSKPTKGNHIAIENPLFNQGGNSAENPMSERTGTITNPYFVDNGMTGDIALAVDGNPIGGIIVKGAKGEAMVDGNPIGGIIVKGAKSEPAAITGSPLYDASGTEVVNPLYKGND